MPACIAAFRDFVIYQTRRFFDNEYSGLQTYPVMNDKGKIEFMELDSPEIYFSDDRIIDEMEKFLHGYNNRFVPVEIPVKNSKDKWYMNFRGRYGNVPSDNPEPIYHRKLTWCDVFFVACMEAVKGKHVLITRFPINVVTV